MKPNLVQINLFVHVNRHTNDDFTPQQLGAFFRHMIESGIPKTIPLSSPKAVRIVGQEPGPDVTLSIAGIEVVVGTPKGDGEADDGATKNGLAAT